MATFVFLDQGRIRPAADAGIIRAADAGVVLEAQRVLDEARCRAAEIVNSAEDGFQAEKRRGFAQGVQEAKQKMAEQMVAVDLRTAQHDRVLRAQTIALVMAIVRKVLGEMDVRSLVVAQVTEALKSVKRGQRLTLRVNPSVADTLRANLTRIQTTGRDTDHMEVETAAHLAPDDLIIESDIGIVQASMAVQLSAIESAFRDACDLGQDDER